LEPLAKQKEVRSKKGVVGRIGKAIPTTPSPRDIKPTSRYKLFDIFIRPSAIV
jgi:hypothetical protein